MRRRPFGRESAQRCTRLETVCFLKLRSDPSVKDPLTRTIVELEEVLKRTRDFDLIHFHDGYAQFPLSRRLQIPSVTTMHGRMDLPDLVPIFQEFSEVPLISISNQQRSPLPFANWVATVLHGIPEDLFSFQPDPGDYAAFVGR